MSEQPSRGPNNRPTLHDYPIQERPRERLEQYGPGALSLTELLAVVIGTGHADEHVLKLAERLLVTFGTVTGLAKATSTELKSVTGVGEVKAARIQASIELGKRAFGTTSKERPRIVSPADAANLLMPEMMLLEQEHLRAILLDTRNNVIRVPTIYIGSLYTSVVRVAEIFRPAIRHNAAALIIAHNHPSGDPSPSPEDIAVTRKVVEAGDLLSIDVLDHLIIGHNQYVSLREKGLGYDK